MEIITNVLTMKFRTEDGKTRTVSFQPCNPDATAQQVRELMDSMISSGAFVYQPSEKLGAAIVQRSANTLF